jgi:hypothetical protein
MGFLNRTVTRPEVMDLYGPYENQIGDLNGWYADAANRANQQTQQIYGSGGLGGPRSGPMYSTMAKNTKDIELNRAKTQYDDKYKWLQGKRMYTPTTEPSGLAQLAGPFIGGMGYSMGPAMGNAAMKGLGSIYDSIASSPIWGGNTGGSSGDWGNYSSASENMNPSAYSDIGASGLGNLDYADAYNWDMPTPDYNFDFGNVWGL